jgi:Ca-activated chloride channel family protein
MTALRAVCAAMLPLLAAPPAADAQVFRGGTDTVFLSVTVTDSQGRLVPGLAAEDFRVFEDGVPQDIAIFARTPQPIALSLLLDTSTSMEPRLRTAQEAAAGFARGLNEHDVAQVIDFDSHVQVLQGFTNDRDLLEAAIRRTDAGGSTALYTAVYVALSEQRKVRPKEGEAIRRQAIVVLSDGNDTSSLVDYEQVLDLAKRSEVVVYAIGLRTPGENPQGRFNEADFVLRTLTEETGGRVFFVDQVDQLPAVYGQIADELANQYSIGYTSSNQRREGTWRSVQVRVDRPNTVARTRQGYFGPAIR